jgi:hypothetical protein
VARSLSLRLWLHGLLCALVVTCLLGPASAQTPGPSAPPQTAPATAPSPKDAAEAKRHFEAGKKLYAEHACTEALAEFEAAYGLVHRPSMLRNIALCHRELRHFADAYDAYDRLLKIHGAELAAADREAVKQALDELSELSGSLVVTSNEAGANVEVDGKSLGATPLAGPTRVSLAAHHVVVTKPGFEPFEKEITLQSNQLVTVEAALALEITTGHVAVREANGDPVDVFIDGQDMGPAPWEGNLPPGEHTLEAKGPKFASERRPFTLVKKQQLDLSVDATTTTGHVRITTLPASASIAFDGNDVGVGAFDADVAPGEHRVVVTLEEARAEREVNVARGQIVALDIPLPVSGEPIYRPVYTGVFGRINLFFALSPTTAAVYPASNVSNGNGGSSASIAYGVGAALHIGYAFDLFAVEFFAAGLFDGYGFRAPTNTTGTTSNNTEGSGDGVLNLGGFFGVGARVTSRGPVVRYTAALIPGLAVHLSGLGGDGGYGSDSNNNGNSTPCNSSLNPCSSSSSLGPVGYAAPGLAFDGGMLVGHTPGAKFFLGITAWMDFAPTLYAGPDTGAPLPASDFYPGRALEVVSGVQFFFGPTLGVQWGH